MSLVLFICKKGKRPSLSPIEFSPVLLCFRPLLLERQEAIHRIYDTVLQPAIPPPLTENVETLLGHPPARIHVVGERLVRVALDHTVVELREMLPDDVDDELRRQEARHEDDPLTGRGGRGEREDVRARYVANVDLRGLVGVMSWKEEYGKWTSRSGESGINQVTTFDD